MVNVLVTGGAGFIGSNFVRWAHEAHPDWRITTLDKLTYAGRLENLRAVEGSPRHTFVKGDIADADIAAPLVHASEVIVHFAAETHVDRSIQSAADFITTDVLGTFVLLEAARQAPTDSRTAIGRPTTFRSLLPERPTTTEHTSFRRRSFRCSSPTRSTASRSLCTETA